MRNIKLGDSRLVVGLIMMASAAFIFAPATLAQSGSGASTPPRVWRGTGDFGPRGFGRRGPAKVVTSAPYTAQAVTTTTQTLSDGTHITRQITAAIARDSAGRTMRSQSVNRPGSAAGTQNGAMIVFIFDPVANQRIEYNTATKTARIFVLTGEAGSQTNSGSVPKVHRSRFRSSNVSTQTQSLDAQTMDGVSAQGTQITRTVAAGAFGNDKPLVSTDEEWYSPDLEMVIQSTRTDPRTGQTTYTLNNLQRAEPSAALFQVPPGFQTKTVDVPSHSAGL